MEDSFAAINIHHDEAFTNVTKFSRTRIKVISKPCLFPSRSLIFKLIALCFSLANGEVHVDSYGFRHVFEDTSNGLLLHYLCQELTLHYLMQAGSYEEHQRKWTTFMRLHGKSMANYVCSNCLFFFWIVSLIQFFFIIDNFCIAYFLKELFPLDAKFLQLWIIGAF